MSACEIACEEYAVDWVDAKPGEEKRVLTRCLVCGRDQWRNMTFPTHAAAELIDIGTGFRGKQARTEHIVYMEKRYMAYLKKLESQKGLR